MTSNRTLETSPSPGNTIGGAAAGNIKRSPTMREATAAASLVNSSQMMVVSQSDVPSMLAISEEYGEGGRRAGSMDAKTEAAKKANRIIDEQLVRMLQQIESTAMRQVEFFGELLERHKNNKKFHAELNGRKKYIEATRRE